MLVEEGIWQADVGGGGDFGLPIVVEGIVGLWEAYIEEVILAGQC